MNPDDFLRTAKQRYDGVVPADAWGERGLFYNPEKRLPRGTYFLTVKERDSENDAASQLSSDDAWRLNLGISEPTYRELFGEKPDRPPKGGVVDTGHDFAQRDVLLPHPVYGWSGWICISNPSEETVETELQPLLDEAYDRAVSKFEKRAPTAEDNE